MNATVLLVEDHITVRESVREYLEARDCRVVEAETWRQAEEVLLGETPDVVVADYLLPDGNALERMARLRHANATVPIVILTGHGTIDLAVRAMKEGAEHFLSKPVDLASLWSILERLLDVARIRRNDTAKRGASVRDARDPFIGESRAIRELATRARIVAQSETPVLIVGETGAGKGVLAHWLHENSTRAREPFVDLNCAGLSKELLDSELFGHERGAFTGAVSAKPGLFETAHRGSLFLDEIGDVDLAVQPKLLKVVEERQFRRLGDVRSRSVDVRLIAATHVNLGRAVAERRFREDLYFRINTIPLAVPPLRQRTEDIPLLARDLLQRMARESGRREAQLERSGEEALQRHAWPGNVRELRNVLERALLMIEGRTIRAEDLQFDVPHRSIDDLFDTLSLDELERVAIERALMRERGNVERAAERLGIGRSTLYDRIRKYGLDSSRF